MFCHRSRISPAATREAGRCFVEPGWIFPAYSLCQVVYAIELRLLVSWKPSEVLRIRRLSWLGHIQASIPQELPIKTIRIVGELRVFFHIRFFCLRKKFSCNFSFPIYIYTLFYFFLPIISTKSYFVLQVKYFVIVLATDLRFKLRLI